MSQTFKLQKGFDINIKGFPQTDTKKHYHSQTYAIKPTDFKGIAPIPKLEVAVGEEVLAGDPLFFDKSNPDIKFCAPVSGEVMEIKRGAQRAISEIIILADKETRFRSFSPVNLGDKKAVIARMMEAGVWVMLKQRPFGVLADPNEVPRDIFVSAFDSSPLAPDYSLVVKNQVSALQAGIDVLNTLTSGKVYLGLNKKQSAVSEFQNLQKVEKYYFDGPHPAGNVGVQIHHIKSINKGDVVWTIDLQDLIILGRLFKENKFDTQRIYTLAGSAAKSPTYFSSYIGANVGELLKTQLENKDTRVISGNCLTGKKIDPNDFLNFYSNQLCLIKEGDQYELFGWLLPSYPRPTISRTFWNGLFPSNRSFDVNTNMHGEKRALVVTGEYEKVLPMDVYPQQLIKAILSNDLDLMEGLGIYEVLEEDLALCEFVCTSKTPVQHILRDGLSMMQEQA
ncbi:MAG: Na(+)-translocating NADH-quinone reductase subunit A [Chitinophagales bacterium]|nr:Na(+)-translocating NADH-quinone reductase subunit A [Bacteroidota bacterium]